jgi:hypothetical protein
LPKVFGTGSSKLKATESWTFDHLAGEEVGLTVEEMIRMLKGGMSLASLLDLIDIRTTTASTGMPIYPD